jgi:hypothetical protein
MTRRTQKHESGPRISDNANFLLRGSVMTGAVALGIAAIANAEQSATPNHEAEARPSASSTVHVEGQIKGAEDNWGHDTAEKVLLYGAGKAAADAIKKLNPEDTTTTPNDIVEMIEDQETYDKVRGMLEQAAEDGQLPQPGDIISTDVTAEVTEMSAHDGEYNYVVDFSASNTEFNPAEDDSLSAASN